MAKVSVIIPLYNTELYIEQTLRSICSQTLSQIEIIVINDGSTDHGMEIVEQIAATDPRIKLYTQTNKGLSLTRNRGMDLAKGEYIYFMDSDDVLEYEALEQCYNLCESKQLDFVLFDAESFNDDGEQKLGIDYRRAHTLGNRICSGMEVLDTLMSHNALKTTSSCLNVMRREFLEENKLRFFPGIIHEDELFTPTMYIMARRVGAIAQPFLHRRIRSNSIMTRQFSMLNMNAYLTVLEQFEAFADGRNNAERAMTRRMIKRTLNGALYEAAKLPTSDRIRVAMHCIRHYPTLIKPKTLIRMIIKSAISRDK